MIPDEFGGDWGSLLFGVSVRALIRRLASAHLRFFTFRGAGGRPDIVDFGGPSGPGLPRTLSNRRAASWPTGFEGREGRQIPPGILQQIKFGLPISGEVNSVQRERWKTEANQVHGWFLLHPLRRDGETTNVARNRVV